MKINQSEKRPIHFNEPIPDIETLKDELWEKLSDLPGININRKSQIDLLFLFSSMFKEEYESLPRDKAPLSYRYYVNNHSYESVDGEILYCMIRHFRPRRIFEIGSGFSTFLSSETILKNKQEDPKYDCEMIAVEPFPNDVIKSGFPGLTKLIPKVAQDIPLSEFERLWTDDILFIDSSHILKIGSDVYYEYLNVLPRLNKGVIVHIHDIFLPAEYPKEWIIRDKRYWNEQYLVQAFLSFNDSFEILWASSYMHINYPDKLEEAFSSYKRDKRWPASFWIRKIK